MPWDTERGRMESMGERGYMYTYLEAAQGVQETRVATREESGVLGFPSQSLGWEDPLEKGKATHSSIPAWRIP